MRVLAYKGEDAVKGAASKVSGMEEIGAWERARQDQTQIAPDLAPFLSTVR